MLDWEIQTSSKCEDLSLKKEMVLNEVGKHCHSFIYRNKFKCMAFNWGEKGVAFCVLASCPRGNTSILITWIRSGFEYCSAIAFHHSKRSFTYSGAEFILRNQNQPEL